MLDLAGMTTVCVFPVLGTHSATHASHLELPSVGGELFGHESWMDTLMPSLKAVPHLSHLMGLASP